MSILEKLHKVKSWSNPDEDRYLLPKQAEMICEDSLWVYSELQDELWLDFVFLEFCSGDGKETQCEVLMHGSGPLGALKECRHTYWGDGGYLFYPNATHIKVALDWLEKKGFELR